MEAEGSIKNSLDEKRRQSTEKFLAKLGLPSENVFNIANFCMLCTALFPRHEIEQNEWRIKELFNLFDRDLDGVLKGEEWKVFHDWLQAVLEPVNALLIVDVQNDFIDGTLALRNCGSNQDALIVLEPINRMIKKGHFDKIIYSLDWHPENHISFYENLHLRELHPDSKVSKKEAKPLDTVTFADPYVEQILWPKHCVMNTWGAQLHKDLVIAPNSEQVRKGQNPDMEAYSVFYDNNHKGSTELHNILRKIGVTQLFVCGLAYDICVQSTCLDGLRLGYTLVVIDDCCCGVDLNNTEAVKKQILENGGFILNSDDVLSLVNKEKRSLALSHRFAQMMSSISIPDSSTNI